MRLIDLTGKKYGLLTVISRMGFDSTKKTTWNVLCDCGNKSIVTGLNLKNGTTKSCGCLKHRVGIDNPKYKEIPLDVKKERKRAGSQYKQWRKSILDRCPVCIKCGSEEKLNAHHLLGSNEFPEQRYNELNSIVLCQKCHIEFHVKYGRKKGFTEKDAENFVNSPIAWLVTRRKVNGGIADLEKAKHYIDLLIELESK